MYELTYIITPIIGEIDLNSAVEKIRGFINNLGAEIKSEKVGEKRRLAYPIQKQSFGYFITIEFKLDGEKIEELQKELRHTSDVLRFLLINKDEITEPVRKPRIKKTDKIMKEIDDDGIFAEKIAKPEKTEKKEKVKIEELDKKLDEILGE